LVQQLRIYCLAADHRTARSEDSEIFEHNKASSDQRDDFVYLLRWPDLATKEAAWRRFRADGEWKEIR
jgi:hypothetical protein